MTTQTAPVPADPWQVSEDRFPAGGTFADKMAFLVRYALLAPSSRNSQPWRFRLTEEGVQLLSDGSRWQSIVDPGKRELHLSLGCALENLLIAGRYFGFDHRVAYWPIPENDGLVADVKFTSAASTSGGAVKSLFAAIPTRATNHSEYRHTALAPADLDAVKSLPLDEGVRLWLTGNSGDKRRINDLLSRADDVLFNQPAYCEELGRCFRQGVFGTPWIVSVLGAWAINHLHLGPYRTGTDQELVWTAPFFGVISSVADDREAHVKCGRVLERLYLTATAYGMSLHPLSQVAEVLETRTALAALLPEAGLHPQQPFRLGYGEVASAHTPRRPLEEVLVSP